MNSYVTGQTIRTLREKKKLTQLQLSELLCVSDRTISKWETQKGLPDITLLEPLAKALGVSVAELLSGACVENANRSGNLLRSRFYVCPVCGNALCAMGAGTYSCCGITLPPLEPEPPDEAHALRAEVLDGEYHIHMEHPMEKDHYLSFFALVTSDRLQFVKLYPEQSAECRMERRGPGILYAFCNRHGLFSVPLPPRKGA